MADKLKLTLINTLQGRKIRDVASIEKSKAFCIKPWVHLFVSQYGTVVPCCITPWDKDQALGDVNEQTIQEIWNGKAMGEFRIKMLKDQPDKRCWQCYENEKMGLLSDRINSNFNYADKLDWVLNTGYNGNSPDSKPIYWDIRISNLCNLKCRICGNDSSSQWYDDAKKMGLFTYKERVNRGTKDFDKLLQQLEYAIPHLDQIYFAGGEPLIMEEHYRILQLLIKYNKTDIRLQYNTNFSQTGYKDQDVFEIWKSFTDVHVLASLDGSGKRGELQRHGQVWEQALANRKRMMQVCPDVNFSITPTISVFNLFHLPGFHKDWAEQGLISVDGFMPHTLKNPPEYNIRMLPAGMKKKAENLINAHIEWIVDFAKKQPPVEKLPPRGKYEKIKDRLHWIKARPITGHIKLDIVINEYLNSITYMNSSDDTHLLPKFRQMCAELDKLRGENTLSVFPELEEILAG